MSFRTRNRRLFSMFVCLSMLFTSFGGTLAPRGSWGTYDVASGMGYSLSRSDATQGVIRIADPTTLDNYYDELDLSSSARHAGRLWSDKSVVARGYSFAQAASGNVEKNQWQDGGAASITLVPANASPIGDNKPDGFSGTVSTDDDFLHVFSALGSSDVFVENVPIDLMISIDITSSMLGVGADRTWQNSLASGAKATNKLGQVLNATNTLISRIRSYSSDSRIAVVVYWGTGYNVIPFVDANVAFTGYSIRADNNGEEGMAEAILHYRISGDADDDSDYFGDYVYDPVCGAHYKYPFDECPPNDGNSRGNSLGMYPDENANGILYLNTGKGGVDASTVYPTMFKGVVSTNHNSPSQLGGGTNVEAGIYTAMNIVAEMDDITYTFGDTGRTVNRIPAVVILGDGATNHLLVKSGDGDHNSTTGVAPDSVTISGDWWDVLYPQKSAGSGGDGALIGNFTGALQGAYWKAAIANKYQLGSAGNVKVYTIGAGVQAAVLDPSLADSNIPVEDFNTWKNDSTRYTYTIPVGATTGYTNGNPYSLARPATTYNFNRLPGDDKYKVKTEDLDLIYPTRAFYAANAAGVADIFDAIYRDISSSLFVPVAGSNDAGVQDAITYTDPIGQYMELKHNSVRYQGTNNNGDANNGIADMALLLFGEMHGLVRTGVYDFQWNKQYMISKRLNDPAATFTEGWYKGDPQGGSVEYCEELPPGLDAAQAWNEGWVYRLNIDTAKQYVETLSNAATIEDPTVQNTVYTLYRFTDSTATRNSVAINPAYNPAFGEPNHVRVEAECETCRGLGYTSTSILCNHADKNTPQESVIYGNKSPQEYYANGTLIAGMYRLSDIRVWTENTGDWLSEDGEQVIDRGYEEALYVNIPANALPLVVANLTRPMTEAEGDVYEYDTNMGSVAAVPLRLFYAIGVNNDIKLQDVPGGSSSGRVDLARLSQEYVDNHSLSAVPADIGLNYDMNLGVVYFDSNYYSATNYTGYVADQYEINGAVLESRTRGDAVVTFSPSTQNQFYALQRPLALYWTDVTGSTPPIDINGKLVTNERVLKSDTHCQNGAIALSIDYANGEEKTLHAVTADDLATIHGENDWNNRWFIVVLDYYAQDGARGQATHHFLAVPRRGSEFGSAFFEGEGGSWPWLCWLDKTSGTNKDNPLDTREFTSATPPDGEDKWVLAAKAGSLRTGDLSQFVETKGGRNIDGTYANNKTNTANNYYLPVIGQTTDENSIAVDLYLGNNGRLMVQNTKLDVTKEVHAYDGALITGDETYQMDIQLEGIVGSYSAINIQLNPFNNRWERVVGSITTNTNNQDLLMYNDSTDLVVARRVRGDSETTDFRASGSGYHILRPDDEADQEELAGLTGSESEYYHIYVPSESGLLESSEHTREVYTSDPSDKVEHAGTTTYITRTQTEMWSDYEKGIDDGISVHEQDFVDESHDTGTKEFWIDDARIVSFTSSEPASGTPITGHFVIASIVGNRYGEQFYNNPSRYVATGADGMYDSAVTMTTLFNTETTYKTTPLAFTSASWQEDDKNEAGEVVGHHTVYGGEDSVQLQSGTGLLFVGLDCNTDYNVTEVLTADQREDLNAFDHVKHVQQASWIDYVYNVEAPEGEARNGVYISQGWSALRSRIGSATNEDGYYMTPNGEGGEKGLDITAEYTGIGELANWNYKIFGDTATDEEGVFFVNTKMDFTTLTIEKEFKNNSVKIEQADYTVEFPYRLTLYKYSRNGFTTTSEPIAHQPLKGEFQERYVDRSGEKYSPATWGTSGEEFKKTDLSTALVEKKINDLTTNENGEIYFKLRANEKLILEELPADAGYGYFIEELVGITDYSNAKYQEIPEDFRMTTAEATKFSAETPRNGAVSGQIAPEVNGRDDINENLNYQLFTNQKNEESAISSKVGITIGATKQLQSAAQEAQLVEDEAYRGSFFFTVTPSVTNSSGDPLGGKVRTVRNGYDLQGNEIDPWKILILDKAVDLFSQEGDYEYTIRELAAPQHPDVENDDKVSYRVVIHVTRERSPEDEEFLYIAPLDGVRIYAEGRPGFGDSAGFVYYNPDRTPDPYMGTQMTWVNTTTAETGLVIQKTVYNQMPEDENKTFTFSLLLTGLTGVTDRETLKVGTVFHNGTDGVPVDEPLNVVVYDNDKALGSFQLANGDRAVLGGLDVGVRYTVREMEPGAYTPYVQRDGENTQTGTVTGVMNYGNEVIEFINVPSSITPATVDISARKVLTEDGEPATLQEGAFTFIITPDERNDPSDPLKRQPRVVRNDADGIIHLFDESIIFTKEGEYTYTVKEDDTNAQPGIAYDQTKHTIVVTVDAQADGTLTASYTVDGEPNGSITFTNRVSQAEVTIEGRKTLLNSDNTPVLPMEPGAYSFSISLQSYSEVDPTVITVAAPQRISLMTMANSLPLPDQTIVSNDADGNFKFNPITFNEPGYYTYEIRERDTRQPNIEYDDTIYYAVVHVYEAADGTLTAEEPTYYQNTLSLASQAIEVTFENRVSNTVGNLAITKFVTNPTNADLEKTFNFTVTLCTAENAPIVGTYPAEVTTLFGESEPTEASVQFRNGIATVSLKPNQTITIQNLPLGARFEVDEDPLEAYTARVTPDSGTIQAGVTTSVNVQNERKPLNSVTLTMSAQKELDGADLTAGQFSFTVTPLVSNPAEDPIQEVRTVWNEADGTITLFDNVTYTTAGDYYYYVREAATNEPGYTTDSTEYLVKVTVGGDGYDESGAYIGSYTITVSVDDYEVGSGTGNLTVESGITFRNTYNPGVTSFTIGGKKMLLGPNGTEKALKDGEFRFVLEQVSSPDAPISMFDDDEDETREPDMETRPAETDAPAQDEPSVSGDETDKEEDETSAESGSSDPIEGTVGGSDETGSQSVEGEVISGGVLRAVEAEISSFAASATYEAVIDTIGGFRALDRSMTVTNSADGNYTFTIEGLDEPGTYTFRLYEDPDYYDGEESPNPQIDYDMTEYEIELQVADDGKGNLYVETWTIQTTTGDPVSDENALNFTNTDTRVPAVSIEKKQAVKDGELTTDKLTVKAGDDVTYELTVTNTGNAPATNVVISDVVPDGLTLSSTGQDGHASVQNGAWTVTWNIPTLDAGKTVKVSFKVRVPAVETATTWTNFGTVNSDETEEPVPSNEVVIEETPEIPGPTKEEVTPGEGQVVRVGDTIEYEITWYNLESEVATVVVTDELDEGVDFVSADPAGAYDPATHTVTWTFEEVPAAGKSGSSGTVSLTVEVNERAVEMETGDPDVVTNQATVRVGDNSVQTNRVENPVTDPEKTVTEIERENQDLANPSEETVVQVGDVITYTIDWKNYKDTTANITITDMLRNYFDFVEASEGGAYDETSRTVTWNFQNQAAYACGSVWVKVRVNSLAEQNPTVENDAGVQVGNDRRIDMEPVVNHTEWNPVKTEINPTEGSTVKVGQEISYSITWMNFQDTSANVTVTDKLDMGVDFVSATDGGVYDAAAHMVTWNIGTKSAGENGTVHLTVVVNEWAETEENESGKVANSATVTVGNESKQSNEVDNPVVGPKKSVTDVERDNQSLTNPGPDTFVMVGDTITYEITYKNYHDDSATVTITDVLKNYFTFVSASDGGTFDKAANTVTWTIADVAANTSGSVTVTVEVNENARRENAVTNDATVKVGNDPEIDTNPVDNPTWTPEKTVVTPKEGELVKVGDQITYAVTWKNYKSEPANIVITDKLETGLDFVSATNGGDYDKETHTVTWTLGEKSPGESGFVTLVVRVNENAVTQEVDEDDLVKNQATVEVGNSSLVTNEVKNPVTDPDKDVTNIERESQNLENPSSDTVVMVGDTITYTIAWRNYQDDPATVVVTDQLAHYFTYVDSSATVDGTKSFAANLLTWTFENVPAHTGGTVTVTVVVNENALTEDDLVNTAGVQVGNDGVYEATVDNPTNSKPEKTEVTPGEGEEVRVGQEIVYQITWKNSEKTDATVTVRDPLDPGVDFVSADEGGVYDAASHTVTWTFENKPANATGTLNLIVKVNQDAVTEGEVSNTAYVKVGNNPEMETDPVDNPVTPGPKKEITAIEPAEGNHYEEGELADAVVHVGDTITYTITWNNTTVERATVDITDTLAPYFDFVSASDGGKYEEGTRTVTWNLGEKPARDEGTVTLTVKVNEKAYGESTVVNQGGVSLNNQAVVMTNPVENPTWTPEKAETEGVTPGEAVGVGDEITYTIAWKNYKDEPATVSITDKLDPGVEYVTNSANEGGVYDEGTHIITWTLGMKDPGDSGMVSFKVRVTAAAFAPETTTGEVKNNATVQVGNDTLVTNEVENPLKPEKTVEDVKDTENQSYLNPSEGTLVHVGDTITYAITWYNPYETAKVVVTDTLNDYFTFVSASEGGAYDAASNTVTWNLGEQTAKTGTVTLTVTVNDKLTPGESVVNDAGVTVGNNAEVRTEPVENPTWEPEKSVEGITDKEGNEKEPSEDTVVRPGDEITYQITWRNYQNETAEVTITDKLDPNVEFVAATDGGTHNPADHTVTWNLGTREPSTEDHFVTVTVRVLDSAMAAGSVANDATVKVGNDSLVSNKVENPTEPKKEVDVGDGSVVKVGDVLTYTIQWQNYHDTAADVTITDVIDIGLDVIESSISGGSYDSATRTITWSLGEQQPGASGEVTFQAKVNKNALVQGSVENQAEIKVGNDPTVKTNPVDNPTTPHKEAVSPAPEQLVKVGDEITYRIYWHNDTGETADVIITDELDPGVDFVSATESGVYDKAAHTVTWTLTGREKDASGSVDLTVKVNENAKKAYDYDGEGSIMEGQNGLDSKVVNEAGVKVGNETKFTNKVETTTEPPKDLTSVEGESTDRNITNPTDDTVILVGDTITYTIAWKNYEDAEADVVITDVLGTFFDFVSASNGGNYEAGTRTVTWTFANQASGAEGVVTLTVKVNENARENGMVNNQATVAVGNTPNLTNEVENPVPDPKKEVAGVEREGAPVQGADSQTSVKVGDVLTYTISWKNYHDEEAEIVITDTLKPESGLAYEVGSALAEDIKVENGTITPGSTEITYDGNTYTVTWTFKASAGASGTVSLKAKVTEAALTMDDVTNTGSVKVGDDPAVDVHVDTPTWTPEKTETGDVKEGEPVQPGDEIQYQITWKNYKDENAIIQVTDQLDPDVDFVSASDSGVYDTATHTVTWNVGLRSPGSEGFVTLTVRVNDSAKADGADGTVTNQAGVQVGNDSNVSNEVENPVPDPKKEVTNPGPGESVKPGDEITYKITWKNYHDTAANVTITDKLDPGVDFKSADNGASYDEASRTVTWTLENQAAGAEGSVALTVVVNANAVRDDDHKVENQAGVKVGNDKSIDTNPVENPTDPYKEEVTPGEGEMIQVGSEITYRIHWSNHESEAADVVITDTLDSGVDFVSADQGGVYDEETRTVTWTLPAQAQGAFGDVELVVRVNENALPEDNSTGEVTNKAGVQVGNNPVVETNPVTNNIPKKDVDVGDKAAVHVGDELTYTISWKNYEDTEALVVITDVLEDSLAYVEGSADPGDYGVFLYDESTATLIWNLGMQPAGTEGTVSFKATVTEDAIVEGTVENEATVQVGQHAGVTNQVENPTWEPEKEEVTPGPDMPVKVGDELTYNITWTNFHKEAADITITDKLDAGVDFVSATNGGTYDPASHTVTWTLSEQAAGTSGTVSLTVKVNENAVKRVENQASVQVGNDPKVDTNTVPNPVPDPEKEITDVRRESVSVTNPDENTLLQEGDLVTYRISWWNYEDQAATVTITDTLDPGVNFVSATNGGTYEETTRTVTWTLINRPAGAEGNVSLTVKVNAHAGEDDHKVENQAGVQVGNDPKVDTNKVPNTVPDPKKEVNVGEGALVKVGQELTYTVSWWNYHETAADITITDTLDPGVEYVEDSADNGGTYDPATHTITWVLANQPADANGIVSFKVTVTKDALTKGEVENQAEVQVGNDGKVQTNPVDNPTTPHKEEVTPGENELVKPGDEITYAIYWYNYESETAAVTITDILDEKVEFVNADNGGQYDMATHTVQWLLEDQPAGASGKVTLTVRVKTDIQGDATVENKAGVQVGNGATIDTNTVPNPVPDPEKKETSAPGANKPVTVGDLITYSISWWNYHDEPADIIITDTLEAGLDFISAANGGTYDPATRTVTWTLKEQDANAKGTVSLTVQVNENATLAKGGTGKVENQAGVQVGNDPKVDTNTVPNPVPDPKKEVNVGEGTTVKIGQELTYTITWRNYHDTVAEVSITDVIDEGLDVTEVNGGAYDPATRTITWNLGEQPAGASGEVTFKALVNEKALVKGEVENQAEIQVGDDPKVETNPVDNPTTPHKEEVTPGEGEMVIPGEEITYAITWANDDPTGAPADVAVTDKLDANVAFVSADHGGTYDAATHTVTWTFENQPYGTTGTVTLVVSVLESAREEGKVENQASVQVGNNPVVDTNTVPNPVPDPEKTVIRPGEGDAVGVGQELQYTISWQNPNAHPAKVIIKDTLDEGVDFVSAEGGVYDAATHTVTWTLENRPARSSGTVTLTVKVNENAVHYNSVTNKATVDVDNKAVDTNVVENPTWEPEKKEVTPGEGVKVEVGDRITYTISWKNYHDTPATVVITDTLDPGVDFDSASGAANVTYDSATRTVTWTLENQASGAEGIVSLTVKVNETAVTKDDVTNTANVKIGNDPAVNTNTVENPTKGEARLTVKKTATNLETREAGDPLKAKGGDRVLYQITVTNTGDGEATNVTITDVVPAGLILDAASISNGGTLGADGRTITWNVGTLAPGASVTVRFTVTVPEDVEVNTTWRNVATVTSPDIPDDPSDDVDVNTGALTVTKAVSGNRGDRRKDFTFTVTFREESGALFTGAVDYIKEFANGTTETGTLQIRNGSVVFTLRHGERITFPSMRQGTHYSVVESGNEGYTVWATGEVGVIDGADGTAAEAAFTNYRGSTPPPPDTEPDTTPDTEPDTTPDTEPDTTPDTEPDTTPDTEPDTTPDTEPDTTPDTEPDTTPDTEPDTEIDTDIETAPETEPDIETEPDTTPDTTPETISTDDTPQTGDESQLGTWIVFFVIAVIGITGTVGVFIVTNRRTAGKGRRSK